MLWIYKIYEKVKPKNCFFSILLSAAISLGAITIAFIPALIQRTYIWEGFTLRMWVGCILGGTWILLAPYLIVQYIRRTIAFFEECLKRGQKQGVIIDLKTKFENNYFGNMKFYTFAIIWIFLVLFLLLRDASYLEKYGIMGWGDVYYTIFLISMVYILYLTAIGLYAIISSLYFAVKIVKSGELEINFYVRNIRDELYFVIDYVFGALRIIATGMLFIPILLDYVEYTSFELLKLLTYLAIIIYSISLFSTLYVPLKEVLKYFDRNRKSELINLYSKYNKITKRLAEKDIELTKKSLAKYYVLIKHIENIENTKILNISWLKSLEFITVIILPMVSLVFNQDDIKSLLNVIFM